MLNGRLSGRMKGDKLSTDTSTGGITHVEARRSLGAFLRLMRARAEPAASGKKRPRRRVTGLRREEAALAAGISVTWYTWLEQGRPVRVSRRTMNAIGRALQLNPTERAHLRRLAETAMRSSPGIAPTTSASGSVRRLVDSLAPHPAYAVNGLWDVLCHNGVAASIFGPFVRADCITGNVLRRLMLDEEWRERFEDWPTIARSAVAQFRAVTGHLVADPAWCTFVARLTDESPRFATLWAAHELAPSTTFTKVVLHPTAGRLPFLYASMQPADAAPDVRVVIYTPADHASVNDQSGFRNAFSPLVTA